MLAPERSLLHERPCWLWQRVFSRPPSRDANFGEEIELTEHPSADTAKVIPGTTDVCVQVLNQVSRLTRVRRVSRRSSSLLRRCALSAKSRTSRPRPRRCHRSRAPTRLPRRNHPRRNHPRRRQRSGNHYAGDTAPATPLRRPPRARRGVARGAVPRSLAIAGSTAGWQPFAR
jgi:hypothetical protein